MNPTGEEAVPQQGFASRLWQYQSERFPVAGHGLLILTFTFSAIAFSRVSRGASGFIPFGLFIVGAITSFLLFFLLRLFDEFKDAEEDARYRPYRPVPRGLVSLPELRRLGIGVVGLLALLNGLLMPRMLVALAVPLVYMSLMGKEFFVRDWLKRHPMAYMLSHMVIMPAIDFYTTGLDWLNAGVHPPGGLQFFLLMTFLNGIVIEVGRKIRAREAEEEGVETYSALYGARRATFGWLGVLLLTYLSALLAAWVAGFFATGLAVLTAILVACSIPALRFLGSGAQPHAQQIEKAAGIWTVGMYLALGAIPLILRALQ
jgi:4-hydroxybenzoate polyprenyltransferase